MEPLVTLGNYDQWKTVKRWYAQESRAVDYFEFKESPMGRDLLGDQEDQKLKGEAECEKVFKGLDLASKGESNREGLWGLKTLTGETTDIPLSGIERYEAIAVNIVKFVSIWGVLYLFIISLGLMGNAFKIISGRSSGRTLRNSSLLSNPVSGLTIGILATVLMQSSSTTTSIVISMAASNLITVEDSAYLVMGANIGTSVTNTLVSIAHLNSPSEYRRAFTGAVFHDMFNWLTVGIFLPLEVSSKFLMELAGAAVDSMNLEGEKQGKVEFLKKITHPATGRVVSVDSKLIEKIAQAGSSDELATLESQTMIKQKSGHVFRDTPLSDSSAGILLLFVSLSMLTTCLLLLVKLLQSVLKGKVASWTRYFLNIDFKHPILRSCGGFDNYILLFFGTGCTILVQSSSVFTSTLTPLVGIGLIHVEKLVALTHGANIGTTVTGVLSALSGDNLSIGMRVALEHVFFNALGTVLWFVVWPLRPVPLNLAKFLGVTASNLRWFPLVYILTCFLVIPVLTIVLSLGGFVVLCSVGIPLLLFLSSLAAFIWVRRNRADLLPKGSILRASTCCGRKLPNFVQLWGGDLKQDQVDVDELRAKEKHEQAKAADVVPWPQSGAAWGLALLAFLGMLLAVPTSQWRRMRYAQERRGRPEYGFGLWEACSDGLGEGHPVATLPPVCDLNFTISCAEGLCTNPSVSYREAWDTCTALGCRSHAWTTFCPQLPSCAQQPNHEAQCLAAVDDFTFQVREQEAGGVVYNFQSTEETPYNNMFGDGRKHTFPPMSVSEQPLNCAGCNGACSDGPLCHSAKGFGAVAFDRCKGDIYATTGGVLGMPCESTEGSLFVVPNVPPLQTGVATVRILTNGSLALQAWSTLKMEATNETLFMLPTDTSAMVVGQDGWDVVNGTCPAQAVPADFSAYRNRFLPKDMTVLRQGVFAACDATAAVITLWDASGFILSTVVEQDLQSPFAIIAAASEERLVACTGTSVLKGSNVARCYEYDVSDAENPVAKVQKVFLLENEEGTVSVGAWSGGGKLIIWEQPSNTLWEISTETGTDQQGTWDNARIESLAGHPLMSAVNLAEHNVTIMTKRKIQDMNTKPPSGMFLPSGKTLVLLDNGDYQHASSVRVVGLQTPLKSYTRSQCTSTRQLPFDKGAKCRPLEDVCPVGGLATDMRIISGIIVIGVVFLGLSVVVTLVHLYFNSQFLVFVACGTMVVSWVMLLVTWSYAASLADLEYGCWFLDESARDAMHGGGLVLLTGPLRLITRPSYSWAFNIYGWGMLTMSLGFFVHRVLRLTVLPYRQTAGFTTFSQEEPVELKSGVGGDDDVLA